MAKLFELYRMKYWDKPEIKYAKHMIKCWVAGKPGVDEEYLPMFLSNC